MICRITLLISAAVSDRAILNRNQGYTPSRLRSILGAFSLRPHHERIKITAKHNETQQQ
jgi:hypothetical protein